MPTCAKKAVAGRAAPVRERIILEVRKILLMPAGVVWLAQLLEGLAEVTLEVVSVPVFFGLREPAAAGGNAG